MTSIPRLLRWAAVPILVLLAGCGGGGPGPQPPPPPPVGCDAPTSISLSVGEHTVVDPGASNGCLRFPSVASGGADQEYLVAVLSGSGLVTSTGVSSGYTLKASSGASAAPPATAGPLPVGQLVRPVDDAV